LLRPASGHPRQGASTWPGDHQLVHIALVGVRGVRINPSLRRREKARSMAASYLTIRVSERRAVMVNLHRCAFQSKLSLLFASVVYRAGNGFLTSVRLKQCTHRPASTPSISASPKIRYGSSIR
jgi:hypothetical protein